jgi:ribokinase
VAARLIVVGSVNVDYLVHVERLPGAGETVIGGELARVPGGKGANAAAAASALGAETTLVAAVGRDDEGGRAERELEAAGVRCDALQRVDAATGAAVVLTDSAGENLIAVAPGANGRLDPEHARRAVAERAGPRTVVLLNLEIPETVVETVAAEARRQGLELVIDPAPARALDRRVVSVCALLTPNAHEVRQLGYASADDLLDAGARAVAVTLGADGCVLHRPDGASTPIPAFAVEVVDTVGAGDAFAAGAAVGLAEGLGVEAAVVLGCAAGALASTGRGARGACFDRGDAQALIEALPAR